MKYIIFLLLVFFISCADTNNQKSDNSTTPPLTDEIINEINNESVVIYEVLASSNKIMLQKEITSENISLDFINPRNEDVRILIPNTNENNINQLTFFLQNNVDYICSANSTCSITFNMIVREQSPLNDNFSFYLPVTLLNESEFTKFININQYDKYKDTAMKYLTNRVYINYLINGQIIK